MEIIKAKNFRIKKVKKVDGYWELYPKGFDEPLRIKAENVYGKLPPVWKFPWQCHELKLKELVGKFIIYIEMDGCILFNLSEDQYSDEMKKEVERVQKIEAAYVTVKEEYRASVSTQLAEYLSQVPAVTDIEDEISKLPVCWSRYLKMFLHMQYGSTEEQQRLFLLYWLVTIANRLYKRHVDVESSMDVAFASVEFKLKNFATEEIFDITAQLIEENPKFQNSMVYALYFEIKQELNRILPKAPQRLKVYLIQIIAQLLENYADDAAELHCKRLRDFWGDTVNTDNEAYRYLIEKMKLPQFSSLIVENQYSQEQIERFNNHY